MFKKVLIANRGEIVRRIMRTCRKLGIITAVVYSEADRDMPYVREADEAYSIGGSSPNESYLNIGEIIRAAKQAGACAIHPGYGFLSEKEEFALACKEAEIAFVGPSSEAIRVMGDKFLALGIAEKAGIPTLERNRKSIEKKDNESEKRHAKRVARIARAMGYPLMIKARKGGGGIGVSVVSQEDELMQRLASCARQAKSSFSSGELYFEKYLPTAWHIEVQILGDNYGNAAHFFPRDCSIQRNNQKLIEEAPAVKLSAKQERLICRYATRILRQIKRGVKVPYSGAGTIEFLVTPDGEIYFIEMNTRLQVEHGITEMITGVDLVELQLLVSSGEKLPFKQKEIKKHGHAIEARIYPEVWEMGSFARMAGRVRLCKVPEIGDSNIRVDSALDKDDEYDIPIDYEPLIMKIIVSGERREECIGKLIRILENELDIQGVETNTDFLAAVFMSNVFKNNLHTTTSLNDGEMRREIDAHIFDVRTQRIVRKLWENVDKLITAPSC